jgi:hypothetical protein
MWKIVLTGPFTLGMAVGCATEVIEVPLPSGHPASVSAAPAPRPPASTTLHANHQTPPPQDAGQAPAEQIGQGAHDAHAAHGLSVGTTPATMSATQPAAEYVCPMHPEVTQATPGTCPKCRMKLVPKEAVGQHGHEGHQ